MGWGAVAAVTSLVACSPGLSVISTDKDSLADRTTETGDPTTDGTTEEAHSATQPPHSDAETNEGPTADAGPDEAGLVTDRFDLDGTGSSDPNGDVLAFEWVFLSRPTDSGANLINEDTAFPSFVADRAGAFVLELAVDDGEFSATDTLTVTIDAPNEGPVANAGLDVVVDVGDRVLLNGTSSYDPENDALSYDWALVTSPPSSSAFLSDASTGVPSFTADVAGVFEAELVVSDGVAYSTPDRVQIVVREPSSGDCNSCATAATELNRRAGSPGQLAGALALLALPVFTARWQRRR